MSFILDALRKSDTERQQQAAPGLATTVQRSPGSKTNIWIPLLTTVLILNAVVLGWFLLTDADGTADDPVAASASPATSADTRSLRREAQAKTDVVAPAPVAPPPPTVSQDTQPTVTDPPPERPDADTLRPALPRFEQLLAGGVISVPPLHLDIHVYAGEPSKRFVFINMNKYREGERLTEGPVVEEITNDGVILNQQGNRFTLERN